MYSTLRDGLNARDIKVHSMDRALLVTDGDCGFCQRSAGWFSRHFPGPWINITSQSLDLDQHGLSRDDVNSQVWLLLPSNEGFQKFGGAQAVGKLLLLQPRNFIKPFALLAFAPVTGALAQWIYRLISRNRHRFSSSEQRCGI